MPDTLIQIAEAALADSYARAGAWMHCHAGCDPCCHGVFPINALDVERLRAGLAAAEPQVAADVRARATLVRERLTASFPGNAATGTLFEATDQAAREAYELAFEDWGNDEPCPVLDPVTRTCTLYSSRPMPCRTFGPPMPNDEGGLAVCELCFVGAPPSEVERCAVNASFLDMEAAALGALPAGDPAWQTVIAFAPCLR